MKRSEAMAVVRRAVETGHFYTVDDLPTKYTRLDVSDRLEELLAPAVEGPFEAYLFCGINHTTLLAVHSPFNFNIWR